MDKLCAQPAFLRAPDGLIYQDKAAKARSALLLDWLRFALQSSRGSRHRHVCVTHVVCVYPWAQQRGAP